MRHVFEGEGRRRKKAGVSCGSQPGCCTRKTSHSCGLLISCPQSTNKDRLVMCAFDSLKKKSEKKNVNRLHFPNTVPATNSLQPYLRETSDFRKCTWPRPNFSRFAWGKSFPQSYRGNELSLTPARHQPRACRSRFLCQALPLAREGSRAGGRGAAGRTERHGATSLAGLAAAGSSLRLCVPLLVRRSSWPHPPDGQRLALWFQGRGELSNSLAQSQA